MFVNLLREPIRYKAASCWLFLFLPFSFFPSLKYFGTMALGNPSLSQYQETNIERVHNYTKSEENPFVFLLNIQMDKQQEGEFELPGPKFFYHFNLQQ